MIYIPFYTKYKALEEDLNIKRQQIETKQKENLDLENKLYKKTKKINKLENALIEIKLLGEGQKYGNQEFFRKKVLEVINELDVGKHTSS